MDRVTNSTIRYLRALFNISTMDESQHAKAGRAHQSKARARRETNQLKFEYTLHEVI